MGADKIGSSLVLPEFPWYPNFGAQTSCASVERCCRSSVKLSYENEQQSLRGGYCRVSHAVLRRSAFDVGADFSMSVAMNGFRRTHDEF